MEPTSAMRTILRCESEGGLFVQFMNAGGFLTGSKGTAGLTETSQPHDVM